jgi:hypothetical protein
MAGYGLSVGEIVGTPNRQRDEQNKKWLPREPLVKGLQIQDLTKDGILVRRKMGRPTETIALKSDFVQELSAFIGKRTKGRIFELSESRVAQLTRRYAKEAGILDEKLPPQTFIRFYERHEGVLPDALSQISEPRIEETKAAPVIITAHEMAQAALLELGNILGYDTYTSDPSKDPGDQFYEVVDLEGYKGVIRRPLGQIATPDKIPDFAPKRILDSAKDIDVIWFKDDLPVVCFEVEHTTNVKQGLLRQFQVSRLVQNARFYVIAPEEQRKRNSRRKLIPTLSNKYETGTRSGPTKNLSSSMMRLGNSTRQRPSSSADFDLREVFRQPLRLIRSDFYRLAGPEWLRDLGTLSLA